MRVFLVAFAAVLLLSTASALNVAYLVKNNAGVDSFLVQELVGQGHSVEVVFEGESLSAVSFDILILGDQNLDHPETIQFYRYKTIVLNSFDYYKLGGNFQLGLSALQGRASSPTTLKKGTVQSSIVQDIPSTFRAYTGSQPSASTYYLRGNRPSGSILIYSGGTSDAVLETFSPGATLLNGNVLGERLVFFGIPKAQYWTSESKVLFRNSLLWLVHGEDLDGDGYQFPADCNDRDNGIHPSASDIPYDGVDQDCSGFDVLDVDGDGFCKEGVSILNKNMQCARESEVKGSDCDDATAIINLLNPDLALNCRNDVPVLSAIGDRTVRVGQELVIVVAASDPEGDGLVYMIDDDAFSHSGSVFRWTPGLQNVGVKTVVITVSDGNSLVAQSFRVTVKLENRDPTVDPIPALVRDEDQVFEVDFRQYFDDADDDSLTYSASGEHLIVEKTQEGMFSIRGETNWFGQTNLLVSAHDGESSVVGGVSVTLRSINDAPIFVGSIPDRVIRSDSDSVDLSIYFSDVDSSLSYSSVLPTPHLDVGIVGTVATITPTLGWNGNETVQFRASDGALGISSNSFRVESAYVNGSAILNVSGCATIISEDEERNCSVSAVENGTTVPVRVGSQTNMSCSILGDQLTYKGGTDFSGNAACVLSAGSGETESSLVFSVHISPVNDAPVIDSVSPDNRSTVMILSGESKTFSVSARDSDGSVSIRWILDGVEQSARGSSFSLGGAGIGTHTVVARVSDGINTQLVSWSAFVGDSSQFLCSFSGGFLPEEGKVCRGTLFAANDSALCCNVPYSFTFVGKDVCSVVSENVTVVIKDPVSREEYVLGEEEIKVSVEVTNDEDQTQEFEVVAQLYDMSEKRAVEDVAGDLEIGAGDRRTIGLTLEVPDDINSDNDYALYVSARDVSCGEDFQDIAIRRPSHSVIITRFTAPIQATCGDTVYAEIIVENQGINDEAVTLELENGKLNLDASDIIELDKFDDDNDKETKEFSFVVSTVANGNYTLTARARYDGEVTSETSMLEISGCKETVRIERQEEPRNITTNRTVQSGESEEESVSPLLLLFSIVPTLVIGGIVLLLIQIRKMKGREVAGKEDTKSGKLKETMRKKK
ncbi:MAG TPA: Ig-like domain-containing protein [Candidatus Nanoarchaeia archaeon]|nr:Ig-like domain-containing protein [Candidatus Nanoarchaeia archaeon]